jgi:hypothetical protein
MGEWLNDDPSIQPFVLVHSLRPKLKSLGYFISCNKINNFYSLKIRQHAETVMQCADVPIAHGF